MSRYVNYDKIYHMDFKLKAPYTPTGDQPQAIEKIVLNLKKGLTSQVLVGVTGSGKTYTMANVIEKIQKPVLVISHNKTLAAQLYQEFRDYFPDNAVSYFVSYYDYYQPEAYIPQSDTYIEKETEINEEIDKLRLAATMNLLTRKDSIIVASVSCIYNLGSPVEYGKFVLELKTGVKVARQTIAARLVDLQYLKSLYDFKRSSFRIRGENIDIYPAYTDYAIRIVHDGKIVTKIQKLDPLNGKMIEDIKSFTLYPAKHYMTDPTKNEKVFDEIRNDLNLRVKELNDNNRKLEAYRLEKRVNFDLEMIQEMGYVNGIENYSRYFDGRKAGDPPYSLLEYFNKPYGKDWLLMIDESHMTIPQIRGMYNGDYARKKTLIDFGFRLPAAYDNRPLRFNEFLKRTFQTIYVSATPDEWEIERSKEFAKKEGISVQESVIEQLIRPTGIPDPIVLIRSSEGQISDLTREIIQRKKRGERVLVTTLTKRMAEDLTLFLNEKKYLSLKEFQKMEECEYPVVQYLHADIKTLERSDILDDLRSGKYDVLIGINLLREGLDLPEVSLVAILDADKEGFLRSRTSLVQTMGRAARHINSMVIMYADRITNSMKNAISEVERRRIFQIAYNKKYMIDPINIKKLIKNKLVENEIKVNPDNEVFSKIIGTSKKSVVQMVPHDKSKLVKTLKKYMKNAVTELNFELAAKIRDKIIEIDKI
jgi:excinuclease ABC subunit B